MFDDLLEQVTVLKGQGKPFVLATVVACKPPTSAKPGAKAIVQPDGGFHGWVGGSCAQPLVTQESLKVLEDGQSRLVLLAPRPEEADVGLEGTVLIPMTCQSEGTLAIYLEPFLPKPELISDPASHPRPGAWPCWEIAWDSESASATRTPRKSCFQTLIP